jgi:hypothetical protein
MISAIFNSGENLDSKYQSGNAKMLTKQLFPPGNYYKEIYYFFANDKDTEFIQ